jgi:hypothetical protein
VLEREKKEKVRKRNPKKRKRKKRGEHSPTQTFLETTKGLSSLLQPSSL